MIRAHEAFLARAAALEQARRAGYAGDAVKASGAIDSALAHLQ